MDDKSNERLMQIQTQSNSDDPPHLDIDSITDIHSLKQQMLADLIRVQNCQLPENKYAVLDFDHKYLCCAILDKMIESQ